MQITNTRLWEASATNAVATWDGRSPTKSIPSNLGRVDSSSHTGADAA